MDADLPRAALAALLRGDVATLVASPPLAAAAAVLVVAALLLALLLARLLLAPRRRRDAVLLLGPCGAGKTALFGLVRAHTTAHTAISLAPCLSRAHACHSATWHQLRDGVFGASVTSMAENVARVAVGGREVTLVDLPGHPRLRGRLDAHATSARALVFLVDGRDGVFLPACRDTAECVHIT